MVRFQAEKYLTLVKELTRAELELRAYYKDHKDSSPEDVLPQDGRDRYLTFIRDLKKMGGEIKLRAFVEHLNRAERDISSEKSTYADVQYFTRSMRDVLMDDTKSHVFIQIDPNKIDIYLEAMKRLEVLADFNPSEKTPELLEARLCFALERYPACVHHLMITVEVSLRKWARQYKLHTRRAIAVEDWAKILKAAQDKLAQLSTLPRTTKRNKAMQHLSATAGHFSFINDAYRKDSAHGKDKFDEQSAKAIMNHVEAFMALLSPKARKTKVGRSFDKALKGLLAVGSGRRLTLADLAISATEPGASTGAPPSPANETP